MNSNFDFDYSFELKLITEIKKHPLLYDFASEDYKNSNLKDMTWNKISLIVCGNETSAAKCKKKWKNLRDTYKRCKERKKMRKGNKKPMRNWKHEKIMQFLDNCQSMRKLTNHPFEDTMLTFDDDSSISDHNNDESFSPIDDIKIEDSVVGQPKVEHCNADVLNADSFNTGDLNEDSMSLVSATSSAGRERANIDLGRTQEEKLTEFCAIKRTKSKANARDSLSLLFESLDKKIHQANLTEEQMTEIESSVFSLVFFKLNDYRKINNKKQNQKQNNK